MGPHPPALSSWCPSLQALQGEWNGHNTQHKPREVVSPKCRPWGGFPFTEFHACPYTREQSPSCAAFPHLSQCSPWLFLSLELQNFSLTSAPGGTLSHSALHGQGPISLSSQGPPSPGSQPLLTGFGWGGICSTAQLLQLWAVEFLSDGVKQFVQGHFHGVLQVSRVHNLCEEDKDAPV